MLLASVAPIYLLKSKDETTGYGEETMMSRVLRWAISVFLASLPQTGLAADSGLITMPSKYSVEVTIQRFEAAIRAKSDQGWMVFRNLITLRQQKRTD